MRKRVLSACLDALTALVYQIKPIIAHLDGGIRIIEATQDEKFSGYLWELVSLKEELREISRRGFKFLKLVMDEIKEEGN